MTERWCHVDLQMHFCLPDALVDADCIFARRLHRHHISMANQNQNQKKLPSFIRCRPLGFDFLVSLCTGRTHIVRDVMTFSFWKSIIGDHVQFCCRTSQLFLGRPSSRPRPVRIARSVREEKRPPRRRKERSPRCRGFGEATYPPRGQ